MTYHHTEEWRMRIILSLAWQEVQPVIKTTDRGELLSCFTHHLDGEGLIQITRTSPQDDGQRVFRFNRHGRLRGIFDHHADGADLLCFDRDSGFGMKNHHAFEVECSAMITCLEQLLDDEEEMAFYL